MTICKGPNCQTSAGCRCNALPGLNSNGLLHYTDEEIAREYHRRAFEKLGDQRVGVTVPVIRSWA
jgi:hypothetical protein